MNILQSINMVFASQDYDDRVMLSIPVDYLSEPPKYDRLLDQAEMNGTTDRIYTNHFSVALDYARLKASKFAGVTLLNAEGLDVPYSPLIYDGIFSSPALAMHYVDMVYMDLEQGSGGITQLSLIPGHVLTAMRQEGAEGEVMRFVTMGLQSAQAFRASGDIVLPENWVHGIE